MDVVAQTTERRILDYNPEFSTSSVRTPLRGRKRKQPAEFLQVARVRGADDGVRTRDPDLGKVVLYQLSHVRVVGGTRFELVTPTVSR